MLSGFVLTCKLKFVDSHPAHVEKIYRPFVHLAYTRPTLGVHKVDREILLVRQQYQVCMEDP